MKLLVPIRSVSLARDSTQLFVCLQDGKLIVIAVDNSWRQQIPQLIRPLYVYHVIGNELWDVFVSYHLVLLMVSMRGMENCFHSSQFFTLARSRVRELWTICQPLLRNRELKQARWHRRWQRQKTMISLVEWKKSYSTCDTHGTHFSNILWRSLPKENVKFPNSRFEQPREHSVVNLTT